MNNNSKLENNKRSLSICFCKKIYFCQSNEAGNKKRRYKVNISPHYNLITLI